MLSALPSSALANPSISVTTSAEGVPGKSPSKVTHRLTLTAGATQETIGISALGSLKVSGDTLAIAEPTAVGPPTSTCGTRWERPHEPFGARSQFHVVIALAPFATAFVDTVTRFTKPPWAGDSLDTTWELTPAQGSPFDVVATAPTFRGAYGVELGFAMTRVSPGIYAVQGTAQTAVNRGRVELWGYAPGRTRRPASPSCRCTTARGRSRTCARHEPGAGSSMPATGPPARPSRTTPRYAARSCASADAGTDQRVSVTVMVMGWPRALPRPSCGRIVNVTAAVL